MTNLGMLDSHCDPMARVTIDSAMWHGVTYSFTVADMWHHARSWGASNYGALCDLRDTEDGRRAEDFYDMRNDMIDAIQALPVSFDHTGTMAHYALWANVFDLLARYGNIEPIATQNAALECTDDDSDDDWN